MNIIRCLIEALNPCVHQYRTVATMYDNKDDPKATTIVSECDICGRTKETVFRAAPLSECRHQWVHIRRVNVMKDETSKIPLYAVYEQKCEKCGDMRRLDMSKEKP